MEFWNIMISVAYVESGDDHGQTTRQNMSQARSVVPTHL